jgi:hypothetical protein
MGMDGYFLNTYAHLRDGGIDMSIKINDKEICHSEALYGGPGHEGLTETDEPFSIILGTTMCDQPIKVRKGDKLDVSARFDMVKRPA